MQVPLGDAVVEVDRARRQVRRRAPCAARPPGDRTALPRGRGWRTRRPLLRNRDRRRRPMPRAPPGAARRRRTGASACGPSPCRAGHDSDRRRGRMRGCAAAVHRGLPGAGRGCRARGGSPPGCGGSPARRRSGRRPPRLAPRTRRRAADRARATRTAAPRDRRRRSRSPRRAWSTGCGSNAGSGGPAIGCGAWRSARGPRAAVAGASRTGGADVQANRCQQTGTHPRPTRPAPAHSRSVPHPGAVDIRPVVRETARPRTR